MLRISHPFFLSWNQSVTNCSALLSLDKDKTTLPITCVNVYLLMHASVHMHVNASDWFWSLQSWQCLASPGGTSPQACNSLHFSSSSLSPFFHLCPLSLQTPSPFQITPFTPYYFYPPPPCGFIDMLHWYLLLAKMICCLMGGGFWLRSISDRHARLFALSEFTAVQAYTAETRVELSSIDRKKKCEMERSQGTLQIFNIVAYWHSPQSIHSPITYCQLLCVFSVYRYCTHQGSEEIKRFCWMCNRKWIHMWSLWPYIFVAAWKRYRWWNTTNPYYRPHGYLIQINYFLNKMFLYTNLDITLNIENILPIKKIFLQPAPRGVLLYPIEPTQYCCANSRFGSLICTV